MKFVIYFVALALFSPFAAGKELTLCRDVHVGILESYARPDGLTLVPGNIIDYVTGNGNFVSGAARRLDGVALTIKAPDVERVAIILSEGRPHQELLRKLRTHVRDNGEASIPLAELLPEFAKTHTGKHAKCEGFNCFNAVLNWHRPQTGAGETLPGTMEARLGRDYARVLEGGEIHFGDVLVVSSRVRGSEDWEIRHAAIYLDENLLWSKPSSSASDPWTFDSMANTVGHYAGAAAKGNEELRFEFHRSRR